MKTQHPKPLPVTLKRIKPNENSSVVSDLTDGQEAHVPG